MLCQAARTMRQDAAQLQKRIASLGGEQPVLRFGATLTVGEYAMPPVLARYLKQHPDAQISMHVADTEQLLRALDDGAIDFAIVEGAFSQSVYDSLLFCTERFLPVCGADYPLPAAAYRIHRQGGGDLAAAVAAQPVGQDGQDLVLPRCFYPHGVLVAGPPADIGIAKRTDQWASLLLGLRGRGDCPPSQARITAV